MHAIIYFMVQQDMKTKIWIYIYMGVKAIAPDMYPSREFIKSAVCWKICWTNVRENSNARNEGKSKKTRDSPQQRADCWFALANPFPPPPRPILIQKHPSRNERLRWNFRAYFCIIEHSFRVRVVGRERDAEGTTDSITPKLQKVMERERGREREREGGEEEREKSQNGDSFAHSPACLQLRDKILGGFSSNLPCTAPANGRHIQDEAISERTSELHSRGHDCTGAAFRHVLRVRGSLRRPVFRNAKKFAWIRKFLWCYSIIYVCSP